MRGAVSRLSGLLPAAVALLATACSPEPPSGALPAAAPLSLPALSGSLGANLTAGPGGAIVLSWLEPAGEEHVLRFARWREGSFGSPQTVARGDDWFVNWADFPSVVPINKEFWAAHWLVRRPAGGYAYDVHASVSRDGGGTWSDALRPHRDDTDTEHGFVTFFPARNGAGLIWLDGRNTGRDVDEAGRGMTLRTAVIGADASLASEAEVDELVCDCCQTDVAMTASGPVAVYRDRAADETRDIFASRFLDGAWRPGRRVAPDGWVIHGCPVNGPVVASRGDDVTVAWFTNADGVPRVRLARSRDGAATFGSAVDVASGETLGRVGVALLDDGTAVVSWLGKARDETAELFLTPVSADGDAGPAYRIAGGVVPLSVPQLIRAGDELLAVWTRRDGTSRALAGARVPLGLFAG